MFQIIKSVSIVILAAGGIVFVVYDMLTGKITEDPKTRKKALFVLYVILILLGIKLGVENVKFLISQTGNL